MKIQIQTPTCKTPSGTETSTGQSDVLAEVLTTLKHRAPMMDSKTIGTKIPSTSVKSVGHPYSRATRATKTLLQNDHLELKNSIITSKREFVKTSRRLFIRIGWRKDLNHLAPTMENIQRNVIDWVESAEEKLLKGLIVCRETSTKEGLHFHMVIILNGDIQVRRSDVLRLGGNTTQSCNIQEAKDVEKCVSYCQKGGDFITFGEGPW